MDSLTLFLLCQVGPWTWPDCVGHIRPNPRDDPHDLKEGPCSIVVDMSGCGEDVTVVVTCEITREVGRMWWLCFSGCEMSEGGKGQGEEKLV